MALNLDIKDNPFDEMRIEYPWMARMDKDETKTKYEYQWFIAKKWWWIVEKMQNANKLLDINYKKFKKRILYPHTSMLADEL